MPISWALTESDAAGAYGIGVGASTAGVWEVTIETGVAFDKVATTDMGAGEGVAGAWETAIGAGVGFDMTATIGAGSGVDVGMGGDGRLTVCTAELVSRLTSY